MDLLPVKKFLLDFIQESALGCLVALLPKGMDPRLVELTKRGVEVMIEFLTGEQEAEGQLVPIRVHVLYRGGCKGPTAGEIHASIERALTFGQVKAKGFDLVARHQGSTHENLVPACIDEKPRTDGVPTLDLHTQAYEIAVLPAPVAKDEKAA